MENMNKILDALENAEKEQYEIVQYKTVNGDKLKPIIYNIVKHARYVQERVGSKHTEGVYKQLLIHCLKKSYPTWEIEAEKVHEIYIDDVLVGTRRFDIFIMTEQGGIILELKHTKNQSLGMGQLAYYMRLEKSAKVGILLNFFKTDGYPGDSGDESGTAMKMNFSVCF